MPRNPSATERRAAISTVVGYTMGVVRCEHHPVRGYDVSTAAVELLLSLSQETRVHLAEGGFRAGPDAGVTYGDTPTLKYRALLMISRSAGYACILTMSVEFLWLYGFLPVFGVPFLTQAAVQTLSGLYWALSSAGLVSIAFRINSTFGDFVNSLTMRLLTFQLFQLWAAALTMFVRGLTPPLYHW
jgi:hypothetical protein